MAWIVLLGAGLLEIVWALALKRTDGFTRLWPTVLACGAATASFVLLSLAVKSLPLGTAYAVWVGVGAIGVTIAGIVAFGESLTVARIVFVLLIAIGVVGLRVTGG